MISRNLQECSASPKPHPSKPHPCNMQQAKHRSCAAIFGNCTAETALQHSLFCSADVVFSTEITSEKLPCNIEKAALQEISVATPADPRGEKYYVCKIWAVKNV